jgi:membrane protein YdbS with pleckstrin-like domain
MDKKEVNEKYKKILLGVSLPFVISVGILMIMFGIDKNKEGVFAGCAIIVLYAITTLLAYLYQLSKKQ